METVSVTPRPRIVLVGSQHGNEPAGCKTLESFAQELRELRKGTIVLFPCVNPHGLQNGERSNGDEQRCLRDCAFVPQEDCGDSNRYFRGDVCGQINKKIAKEVRRADFVIDLHEAYEWNRESTSGSVGQSLIPNSDSLSEEIAEEAVAKLNESVRNRSRKFDVLREPMIEGTLRQYATKHGVPGFTMETVGIDHPQPIHRRTAQMRTAIKTVLKRFGVEKYGAKKFTHTPTDPKTDPKTDPRTERETGGNSYWVFVVAACVLAAVYVTDLSRS